MNVFDSSALLAFLQGEPGAEVVAAGLEQGGACVAVNWSEVAQKIRAHGRRWDLAAALLDSFELAVAPVERADAEAAAARWRAGDGMSLADRLCLAAGARLGADVVYTADRAWGDGAPIRQIR